MAAVKRDIWGPTCAVEGCGNVKQSNLDTFCDACRIAIYATPEYEALARQYRMYDITWGPFLDGTFAIGDRLIREAQA